MQDFILDLLLIMSSTLALLVVTALWAVIIFVIVDEIVGLFKDTKESDEPQSFEEYLDRNGL